MDNYRKRADFANYSGNAGAAYHEAKHGGGEFYDKIVARSRSQKFQPFVKETDVVLEYGVGTGYNLVGIRCHEKVGYDVAEACRAKVESKGIYFTSDIQEVLEWQSRFDVVICHHALEHVPNPQMDLSRIRQVLKPTGRILLCVPFEKGRRYRRFAPGDPDMHLFSWKTQTICNLLLLTSYEICSAKIRPFGYERALAPLAKLGFWCYKAGLWIARIARPVPDEIFVVAMVAQVQKEDAR